MITSCLGSHYNLQRKLLRVLYLNIIDTSGLAGCPSGEESLSPEQITHTDARVEILLLGIVTGNGSRTFDIRVRSIMILSRLGLMCLSKS